MGNKRGQKKISSYLIQNQNVKNNVNQNTRRNEDSLYADVWAY